MKYSNTSKKAAQPFDVGNLTSVDSVSKDEEIEYSRDDFQV